MNQIIFLGVLVLGGCFLQSGQAQADWQGTFEVNTGGAGASPNRSGKVFAKASRMRIEATAEGHNVVILSDMKTGKYSMLLAEQKMVMELPADQTTQQLVLCSTDNVDSCFKNKGFKSIGKEVLQGHPCVILEGSESHGGTKIYHKIWRPTDLKEVFMLKSVSRTNQEREVIAEIKNVKIISLQDAIFAVPSDFHRFQLPMGH
ncbi:DUF4412 domain-containing protein [Bdellovibrionota bacterium FG-1]